MYMACGFYCTITISLGFRNVSNHETDTFLCSVRPNPLRPRRTTDGLRCIKIRLFVTLLVSGNCDCSKVFSAAKVLSMRIPDRCGDRQTLFNFRKHIQTEMCIISRIRNSWIRLALHLSNVVGWKADTFFSILNSP